MVGCISVVIITALLLHFVIAVVIFVMIIFVPVIVMVVVAMLVVVVILVVECVEIKIGHQTFDMIHHFSQFCNEFVEVLLIDEELMSFVSVPVEALFTFGDGEVIIIPSGCPNIEKIRPTSTCPYFP